MLHDEVTLYYPGDGATEGSNSATYKGIKEFKDNDNGTITFKTRKHGTITTPLPWRLKTGIDGDVADDDVEIAAAPAGNQARRRW